MHAYGSRDLLGNQEHEAGEEEATKQLEYFPPADGRHVPATYGKRVRRADDDDDGGDDDGEEEEEEDDDDDDDDVGDGRAEGTYS